MCGIISFHLNWIFTVKAILNGIPKSKKYMRYCHVAVNEGKLKRSSLIFLTFYIVLILITDFLDLGPFLGSNFFD